MYNEEVRMISHEVRVDETTKSISAYGGDCRW